MRRNSVASESRRNNSSGPGRSRRTRNVAETSSPGRIPGRGGRGWVCVTAWAAAAAGFGRPSATDLTPADGGKGRTAGAGVATGEWTGGRIIGGGSGTGIVSWAGHTLADSQQTASSRLAGIRVPVPRPRAAVGRFLRNGDVMRMALLHRRRAHQDEAAAGAQFLDVPGPAVSHAGPQSPHQLIHEWRQRSLVGNP